MRVFMQQTLGMVETKRLNRSHRAADAMVKSANGVSGL